MNIKSSYMQCKNLIYVGLFILAFHKGYSQTDDASKYSASYLITSEMIVKSCSIDGTPLGGTQISAVNKYVQLISETTDKIIFRYLDFPAELSNLRLKYNVFTPAEILTYKLNRESEIKYFIVDKTQFNDKCKRLYDTWHLSVTFGSTIIPIKLRHKPFDFSKDFSLGPTIGGRFRIDKYSPNYLNLLYSLSITSVTIDSSTITNNQTQLTNTDVSGITNAIGLVGEFSGIQAGIFLGWDVLSKKDQDHYGWIYNRKSWISVGFGLTIFANNKEASFSRQHKKQLLTQEQETERAAVRRAEARQTQ